MIHKRFICSSTEPVVETRKGKLRGYCLDGTYTFHGIKYADAKRFKMPHPVQAWEGIKDALNYGYIAPLLNPFDIKTEMLMPHRLWIEDEDCQYLNIWSRSLDSHAKMPVMVWLHGGGFSAGSSIEQVAYDGDNLSRYGDVVVITLNHRLNLLGYLDLSFFGSEFENSGNVGMADIVEALRWIHDHISNFGGDPDNVTIFGQSGGGGKVTALCQIPSAAGLFHKAIIMSGVFDMKFGAHRNDQAIAEALLRELGYKSSDVSVLESLPFTQLATAFKNIEKQLRSRNIQTMHGPTPNDWYIGDPLDVGFSENARKIPTLAGTVISEFSYHQKTANKANLCKEERRALIKEKFGDAAEELIRLFKHAYPDKNEVDLLTMDAHFRVPTLRYLEEKSAVSPAPVYSYMFSLEFDFDDGKPAWHCADIPFVFHNTELVPVCNMEGVSKKLENQFCGAFVNFARNGNPDHPEIPHWQTFKPNHKATMVFDRHCEIKVDYERELMDLLQKSTPALKPGFMSEKES